MWVNPARGLVLWFQFNPLCWSVCRVRKVGEIQRENTLKKYIFEIVFACLINIPVFSLTVIFLIFLISAHLLARWLSQSVFLSELVFWWTCETSSVISQVLSPFGQVWFRYQIPMCTMVMIWKQYWCNLHIIKSLVSICDISRYMSMVLL